MLIPQELKEKWGIYRITNKNNNRVYIGKSTNLYRRWNDHLYNLKKKTHANLELQFDYDLYGEKAFEFSVIEFTEKNKTTLAFRELDNIYTYSGSLYNVDSPKDKEIWELCKLMKQNNISFDLGVKLDGVLVDLVIYEKGKPDVIHSVIDVHDDRPMFVPLIEKRKNISESFGYKFLAIEPNDVWFSREETINY